MSSIKDVTDLKVYRLSLEFLDRLYDLAYRVPHLKLRTQLTNSGEAIPPLITEGFAKRRNHKEMLRFYEMAMAESDEVLSHMEKVIILSKRFPRILKDGPLVLKKDYKGLSKQINSMIQKLR